MGASDDRETGGIAISDAVFNYNVSRTVIARSGGRSLQIAFKLQHRQIYQRGEGGREVGRAGIIVISTARSRKEICCVASPLPRMSNDKIIVRRLIVGLTSHCAAA